VRECVAPAFLNKMIAGLQALITEGIDYSCTQQALEEIQAENSHLFQFCKDTGLAYNPSGIVTAFDIWQRLENWYMDNGTLSFEESSNGKVKAIWQEQSKPSDKTVKAINQALPRIKALWPKAKLTTVPHPSGKRKLQALQGISFDHVPTGQGVGDRVWGVGDNTAPTTALSQASSFQNDCIGPGLKPQPMPSPHPSHNVPMSITGTAIAISQNSTPNPTPNPHQQSYINQDFHTTHTSYERSDEKNYDSQQKADLDQQPKSDINVNVDGADSVDENEGSKSDINPNIDCDHEVEGEKQVWSVCDEVPPSSPADSRSVDIAVPSELIAMPESLLTTQSGQQPSDDVAPACPQDDVAASQQPASSQTSQKPKSDKSAKPLFANEAEKLMGNVILIKECVADQSWDLIAALTEEWTIEFKAAVWKQLTAEERKAVKQLKPQKET
jgi:putative DNA primase/helicase